MMIKKTHIDRTVNRVLKSVLGALPAIPYLTRRRRTPVAAYIAAGIGVALAIGIVALMFFSPRTRFRALNAAKGGYGKVSKRLIHRREKGIEAVPSPVGQVEGIEQPTAGI